MLKIKETGIVLIDPNLLIPNQEIEEIYGTPKNYEDIKINIQSFGIIQPIIVNKSTYEVLSGNLRLKVALELNLKEVPILFCELDTATLMRLAISTNVHREKTLLNMYNELVFIDSFFNISKGSRTDLDPQLMEESELKKKLMSVIPTYKVNQIKKAIKLLGELEIDDVSDVLVQNIKRIDNGAFSLNAYVIKLEKELEEKQLKENVPEFFEIHRDGFVVKNDDNYSKPLEEDKSVSVVICSPPYYLMRKYGSDSEELGREKTKEEYVKNLVRHFKECHRILKDDGSLFVNIGEGIIGDGYQGVIHLFVVEMLKTGLFVLNDELIWSKHNPVYTTGNRFVRAHEFVFHFVKANNNGFKYNSALYPFIKDQKEDCVYGIDKESPKILSSLDMRDNTFYTNVANTGKLRKLCKSEGIPMDHTATFPISVPALLILLTTDEGDTVMDIFGGTNVCGEACLSLKRKYIGYEKYASHIKATAVRINNMAA